MGDLLVAELDLKVGPPDYGLVLLHRLENHRVRSEEEYGLAEELDLKDELLDYW
ncbi:hypothetical protein AM10699_15880 [Acaryochloris marina MBIC10699]|nr:hypothetical protein AM10699_15880 [Acaryochloris marina MBIC10699]